jgi:hypothetical protein
MFNIHCLPALILSSLSIATIIFQPVNANSIIAIKNAAALNQENIWKRIELSSLLINSLDHPSHHILRPIQRIHVAQKKIIPHKNM